MTRSIKVALAAAAAMSTAICSAQRIHVQVDGNLVHFAYTQPQYVNGRVLVPLRGVFEEMGATVGWNQATRTVTANKSGTFVALRIGDPDASINDARLTLDVPAMIIDGTTMVPIRFVSEALGAQVGWMDAEQLVTITTASAENTQVITRPPQRLRSVAFYRDDVIPAVLDQTLSTSTSQRGDTFTCTIGEGGSGRYVGMPRGTKLRGHIAAIHRRNGDRPAILDLAFDRIVFPNGKTARCDGYLTSLDGAHVSRNENGIYKSQSSTDERMVYAGYGAGAGLLVGVMTKKPLEGTLLGGALGYILGQVRQDQRRTADVTVLAGTELGVRLTQDLAASW